MDIEAALIEARTLASGLVNGTGEDGDAERLAELFESIDGWLKTGGYLPQGWARV